MLLGGNFSRKRPASTNIIPVKRGVSKMEFNIFKK
jgi:hypothetical protein